MNTVGASQRARLELRPRAWPLRCHRFHLVMLGWGKLRLLMKMVSWCGHSRDFVLWPEADGYYWVLVAVVPGSD